MGEAGQDQDLQMTGTYQAAWSQLPVQVVHVMWTCLSHQCAPHWHGSKRKSLLGHGALRWPCFCPTNNKEIGAFEYLPLLAATTSSVTAREEEACAGVENVFPVLEERIERNDQLFLRMWFLLFFGATNFRFAFTVEKLVIAHDPLQRDYSMLGVDSHPMLAL